MRRRVKRPDFTVPQLLLEVFLVLFGVDQRRAEAQPLLTGDVFHDVGNDLQVGVATRGAAGTDK